MRLSTTIINTLIDCINEDLGLSITQNAVVAYETKNLPVPIKKLYFSFSAYDNSVVTEKDVVYNETNTVTIRMNCFTPLTNRVTTTHNLAEVVLTYIGAMFAEYVSGYSIGETSYDSNVDAYKITCFIHFKYSETSAGSTSPNDPSSSDHTLCQAHINNSSIHLSAAEREYLNSPIVTGTYNGTGYGVDNNITLGFRPTAVIVYRRSYHPSVYSAEEAASLNEFGFGSSSGCTKGLALTSTGFKVRQNQSDSTYDSNTVLNEINSTYVYIAFR